MGNINRSMTLSLGTKTAINCGARDDDCSYILLLFAARDGDTKTVCFLLDNNAAVDVRNGHGATPLHFAASGGHLKVARLLLKHGASVDAADNSGKTPLLRAVANGDSKLVRLLLQHGANASISDMFGWTAQRLAARAGNFKILAALQYYDRRKSCWTLAEQCRSFHAHSMSTVASSFEEANPVETKTPFSITMVETTTSRKKNGLRPLRPCPALR